LGSGRLTVVVLAALVLAGLGVWAPAGELSTEPPPGERGEARDAGRDSGYEPARTSSRPDRDQAGRAIAELREVVEAPPGYTRQATVRLGESARGRPIRANAMNGFDRRPLILVVGCIHGDECAASPVVRTIGGCPPLGDGIVIIPNLNPDGRSLRTRTNARGVDLNRNFASGWRPAGAPGDEEHSGTRPFSEPETRIARRLIDELRPDITIWFHQQGEAMVRAWGESAVAGRLYARLAGMPFHRLPWLPGSAPNWQNARYPDASSFVVELPLGTTTTEASAQIGAILKLALKLGRDE